MRTLPSDVWLQVMEYLNLDLETLTSLRLVSKTMAGIAEKPLFQTIVLRPNYDSFLRAQCIARHATFSTVVKVIELRAETVFETI